MDIIEDCSQLDEQPSRVSEFAQDLQLVFEETSQFCAFDEKDALLDTSSFWQNFIDLIHSGFTNLSINYELLLTGEIGAIFVVALIPLLLGIFLETTLLISHNRKESRQEKRQQAKLVRTHGSMLANTIAEETKSNGVVYRAFSLSLFAIQLILVGLFLIAVPEYDRDVWCDEHKTQYAILKSGLETERLQHSQRLANCEIRQAVVAINNSVDTLGDLFSKENNTTLNRLKRVSSSVNDSIAKLDSTKETIDGFQRELKYANKNTENVVQTLNIMQDIAWQLGLKDSLTVSDQTAQVNGPVQGLRSEQNLPLMLKGLATQLQSKPDQKQWQSWVAAQDKRTQQLEALILEQAAAIKIMQKQQEALLTGPMVNAISDKVIKGLTSQPSYPLILKPQSP